MDSQTELFGPERASLSDRLQGWTGRHPRLRHEIDKEQQIKVHIETTLKQEAKLITQMARQLGLKLGRMSPLGQLTVLSTAAGALIATVARDKTEAERMFQAFQANAERQLAAQLQAMRKG